ncbi:MAG: hypothetical protein OXT69_08380 [Candidatus Poribacteria bacterium]|nr:hypothetical protein [Candidatus Poribacteria bacterium]
MPISDELLEILVCPLSRKPLVYDPETDALISTDSETRRCYRIENGIPIMLADDEHSKQMSEKEWSEALAKLQTPGADE